MNPLEHSEAGEGERGEEKYKRRMKALEKIRGEWRKTRGEGGKKTTSQTGRRAGNAKGEKKKI